MNGQKKLTTVIFNVLIWYSYKTTVLMIFIHNIQLRDSTVSNTHTSERSVEKRGNDKEVPPRETRPARGGTEHTVDQLSDAHAEDAKKQNPPAREPRRSVVSLGDPDLAAYLRSRGRTAPPSCRCSGHPRGAPCHWGATSPYANSARTSSNS